VLDRLPCDLLIVKPADFSCPEMDEVKEMQEGLQARSD